jgi:hypothetical protein
MRDDLNRRDTGMGSMAMWAIAAVTVFGLLFMWAPWSNHRTADNATPGTTVGSTANRPAAPASPAPVSPAAPAAPTTTR